MKNRKRSDTRKKSFGFWNVRPSTHKTSNFYSPRSNVNASINNAFRKPRPFRVRGDGDVGNSSMSNDQMIQYIQEGKAIMLPQQMRPPTPQEIKEQKDRERKQYKALKELQRVKDLKIQQPIQVLSKKAHVLTSRYLSQRANAIAEQQRLRELKLKVQPKRVPEASYILTQVSGAQINPLQQIQPYNPYLKMPIPPRAQVSPEVLIQGLRSPAQRRRELRKLKHKKIQEGINPKGKTLSYTKKLIRNIYDPIQAKYADEEDNRNSLGEGTEISKWQRQNETADLFAEMAKRERKYGTAPKGQVPMKEIMNQVQPKSGKTKEETYGSFKYNPTAEDILKGTKDTTPSAREVLKELEIPSAYHSDTHKEKEKESMLSENQKRYIYGKEGDGRGPSDLKFDKDGNIILPELIKRDKLRGQVAKPPMYRTAEFWEMMRERRAQKERDRIQELGSRPWDATQIKIADPRDVPKDLGGQGGDGRSILMVEDLGDGRMRIRRSY